MVKVPFSKYFKPKSQAEYDAQLRKLQTKLKTEQSKAEARLLKIKTKNRIKELKGEVRKSKHKGRQKFKLFGRELYA